MSPTREAVSAAAMGRPEQGSTPSGGSAAHEVASVGANRTALVMAGGTGGHIFPGLAVAEALRERGWRVHWLGGPNSMESARIPKAGFPFETLDFSGLRGKGLLALALLPLRLLKAFAQSIAIIRRVRPQVVVGLGGYISFPAGLMSVACGKPLVLHEQNAVAGLANRVLATVADRVFTAFPAVLGKAEWVGNPLRAAFTRQPEPAQRFGARASLQDRPLRLLVLGGSLGARALNEIVPQALARIPGAQRPEVIHQSGESQIDALRANYAKAGVAAQLTPFIEDTAQAFADADLVICRAGASTVTEIAAVGVAAIFVPFPFAVDDHQTRNARFLVDQGGGWLVQQKDMTPDSLAEMLQKIELSALMHCALKAKMMQKTGATNAIVQACEALAATSA